MNRNPLPDLRAILGDVTISDVIDMRTAALAADADPDAIREDAFKAAVYAASAAYDASTRENGQVRLRARIVVELMEGTRRGHPHALSATAAETAAGRDREYMAFKDATAQAVMVSSIAAAIARDLAKLASLPEIMPTFGRAEHAYS